MSTRIVVEFSDPNALRAFADEHLAHGRAIVRCETPVDLLEQAALVVKYEDESVEFASNVAHPRLPRPDGAFAVALALSLTPAKRAELARFVAYSQEPATVPPPVGGGGRSFARSDRDARTPRIVRTFELPEPTPPHGTPAVASRGAIGRRPVLNRDTPVGGKTAALAAAASRPKPPAPPAQELTGHASNSPGRYRVLAQRTTAPERTMRAHDYFEAARADIEAGSLDLARSNLNLAIAYDPSEPAFTDLLAEVERMLAARVA